MSKLSLLAKYQSIPQGMTMHGAGELLERCQPHGCLLQRLTSGTGQLLERSQPRGCLLLRLTMNGAGQPLERCQPHV